MERIKINEKKSIGDVVFILEGKDTEFRLFTNIFEKIFSITTIKCRSQKTDLREYILPDNRESVIYLLNSKTSSINSVDDNEYIELLFRKINDYFKIDISNSAIYYIWDRDNQSNKYENVKKMIGKYYNSRDNGYELQGLLLLSYPSIESFMISCFEADYPEYEISNLKTFLTDNKYHFNKLDKDKLLNATNLFLKRYRNIIRKDFSVIDVDLNMKENNVKIFEYEEEYYLNKKFYYYFSTILISLFDLGILEITE